MSLTIQAVVDSETESIVYVWNAELEHEKELRARIAELLGQPHAVVRNAKAVRKSEPAVTMQYAMIMKREELTGRWTAVSCVKPGTLDRLDQYAYYLLNFPDFPIRSGMYIQRQCLPVVTEWEPFPMPAPTWPLGTELREDQHPDDAKEICNHHYLTNRDEPDGLIRCGNCGVEI